MFGTQKAFLYRTGLNILVEFLCQWESKDYAASIPAQLNDTIGNMFENIAMETIIQPSGTKTALS